MEQIIINEKNLLKVRKKIQESQGKLILIQAQDEEFNRKILENKNINILLFPPNTPTKDKLKQLDSGLNEFLCKLAKQNNIKIGINLPEYLKGNDFQIANSIAHLRQNIKLCKKNKTKLILINSKKSNSELRGFLLTLGMSTQMIKFALENKIKI